MTIIFDVSQTHFSLASLHFLAFRSRYLVKVHTSMLRAHSNKHVYYLYFYSAQSFSRTYLFIVYIPNELGMNFHLTRRTVGIYSLPDIIFVLKTGNPRNFFLGITIFFFFVVKVIFV